MNRLDSRSRTVIYPENTLSHFNDGSTRRLIVLIPSDTDYTSATRRISDLARTSAAHVLILGLCQDAANELSLRRELVTLSALLHDARISAEAKVEIGMNWVEIVKSNYRAGDMIICFAEQRVGLLHRPLSQILESNVGAPVYLLSSPYLEDQPRFNWVSEVAAWAGSIGIIAGAFLLQIRIVSMPRDWTQTALLILSVIAEAWLIGVWNSLFS